MKNWKAWLIILVVILALGVIATGLIFLRGNEDGWICNNGEWTKHGNPSASKPTELCPGQKNQACTEEAKICSDGSAVGRTGPNCEFAPCPATSTTQIANPASVNCKEKGGTSEIITKEDGSQYGNCKLPDGSECEEWAFMRGECPQGSSPIDPRAVGSSGAPIVIPGAIK
ncbi:MAG: DUF333 domain-containing protein [Candidatus Buchananbacteria bacterium]